MKKARIIVITCIMLIVLCACGGIVTSKGTNNTNKEEPKPREVTLSAQSTAKMQIIEDYDPQTGHGSGTIYTVLYGLSDDARKDGYCTVTVSKPWTQDVSKDFSSETYQILFDKLGETRRFEHMVREAEDGTLTYEKITALKVLEDDKTEWTIIRLNDNDVFLTQLKELAAKIVSD